MFKISLVFVFVISMIFFANLSGQNLSSLLDVNYRQLVSRADLIYDTPVSRSEEGLPVGNGRMGSMVWTEPSMLKFQINRVDVFAMDGRTVSFPQADSDFSSGCGYVDISLTSAGDDVFVGGAFKQHLSLYDALMTAHGKGVSVRVLAWPHGDVMAIEIDDRRTKSEPISINLRMLRYQIQRITGRNYELASQHAVEFQTAQHRAISILGIQKGYITLTQKYQEEFREFPPFYGSSAVAIAVIGRPSKARYLNDTTVQLSAVPGNGKFTILISSASSMDPGTDVTNQAIREFEAAAPKGFERIQKETADWWHDFWAKGFVYLGSESGQAEFVEANYTYFIYLMGAASRGDYPPHFNGMLWRTTGDMSRWGSQYWSANTMAYYSNLMPANRMELMNPLFSMYFNMKDACTLAAQQQWGSKGIWIPEICWFNGPEFLPENMIQEFQDLFLVRKPYEKRSKEFQWYIETKTRHASRYNFQADGNWDHGHLVVPTKASIQPDRFGSPEINGIFGHCTHILSVASRIANTFYQRYQFTQDKDWLRDKAYPMIKGAAEFYRHFPNFKKGEDGKYHIYHVNSGESAWNSADPPDELRALRMIFPLAIKVSKMLNVDGELRPLWIEIVKNLINQENRFGRSELNRQPRPYGSFVYGGKGTIEPIGDEPELKARFLGFYALNSFIDSVGIGGSQIFRNRLRLREGPGAIDAEHVGGLAMGIHQTLLNSAPEQVDGEPILKLFNDWPKSWDAAFTLRAQGGFVVSSAQLNGQVDVVEILSLAGSDCSMQNPWGDQHVLLYRNSGSENEFSGSLLQFPTSKDERIIIVPKGNKAAVIKIL